MPINIDCWNEYDPLKIVILGNVFQEHIPIMYKDDPIQQDAFAKIVEETIEDLNEIQKVLEQNNVQVLRPSQPKDYNMSVSQHIESHSPLINMRDFHMAYGNMFFMTYGSYPKRRFQHAWVEDIVNQMIVDDNIVISANEPNIPERIDEAWEKNYLRSCKNLFHTACILKHNKKAFVRENAGSTIGKQWMTKMLSLQGIEMVEIPGYGHLDAEHGIIREDIVFTVDTSLSQWDGFKYKLFSGGDKDIMPAQTDPQTWLIDWQGYYQNFQSLQNCLSISPDKLLMTSFDRGVFGKLYQLGIEPIYTKWRHGKFWGGGLHCITCDIQRKK